MTPHGVFFICQNVDMYHFVNTPILIQAISQAISTDEYAEFCASNGMEPSGLYGDELQSAWDADYEMIKEIFDSGAMG